MSSRHPSIAPTLHERVNGTGVTATPASPAASPRPGHRWVLIDGRDQALLATWRRTNHGTWEGLVARVGADNTIQTTWISADRLTPHPPH